MTTIGQVMNAHVAALSSDATVVEAIKFLTRHHIGGAPVVDQRGNFVGMISEAALIDVVFDAALCDAPVSRFMTEEVQAVTPREPLSRAAQLFALYNFRRLPVVENGKLVGIFTRRDLMSYVIRTENFLVDPLISVLPSLSEPDAPGEAPILTAELQDIA